MYRPTIAVAAVALLVAGCSAPAPTPAATPSASPSASPSETPTPTPAATPTRDLDNLPIGDHITLIEDDAKVGTLTLLGVKYTKSPYRDKPLFAARVKACATEQKMTITSSGWLVETAAGDQYEAASDQGEGDPEPMYPLFDRSVSKGRCVQGWIPFEIGKSTKVSHVGYQVSDEQTVYWKV